MPENPSKFINISPPKITKKSKPMKIKPQNAEFGKKRNFHRSEILIF